MTVMLLVVLTGCQAASSDETMLSGKSSGRSMSVSTQAATEVGQATQVVDSPQNRATRDLFGAIADAIDQGASQTGASAGEKKPVVTQAETGFGQETHLVDPEQGPPTSDTLDLSEDPLAETVLIADDFVSADAPSETLDP